MKKLFGLFLALLVAIAPVNIGQATLVQLPAPFPWPGVANHFNANPALGTALTITAVGHYLNYVFVAREDMTLSHVGFRAGAVSGTTPVIEVRVETVDTATGLPSGTLWATDTNGITGTITANTWFLQALTASATITKGQAFCIKLLLSSGTTPSIGISNMNQVAVFQNVNLPYQVNNTGSPAKAVTANNTPIIALGSSATTFYQNTGSIPVSSMTGGGFSNSVAGAKRGLRFTIPMNARAVGVRLSTQNSAGDYNVCLYDDAGAELSNSCTAYVGAVSAVAASGDNWTFFDNTVTLTAGTTYRIAAEPTTATNIRLDAFVLPSTNYRSASPIGTVGHYTTFTTAGGWVDSATDTVPLIDVLLDQVDNGSGTGGGGRCIGC